MKRKVGKVITQQSNEFQYGANAVQGKRGITVYTTSQLQQLTGRDKEGRLVSWGVEQPYFYLSIQQRIEIAKLSSPVFGVITSRQNRLSGLPFNITTEKKEEDRLAIEMKDAKAIYEEYRDSSDLAHLTMKAVVYKKLIHHLPELKPDMSNFDSSLVRWKRRLKHINSETCDAAKNWLQQPNQGVKWQDFVKKWVGDYYIHGSASVYKKESEITGTIENFDTLPGGSVYRIKSDYMSAVAGYVQILPGYPGFTSYMEPQFYFGDEISYCEYIPSSSRAYGFIPLEALINKIAESFFFDDLMANQADGTKFPEKMVIVTDNSPFGSMDESEKAVIPLDYSEQKRLEEKLNTPVKGSIMTFSGNSAQVIDLSKENTMQIQMQRQKDIREEVALVFNMSNMEVNLSGSEDTSGRSTSEAQADIEQGKGIAPAALALSNVMEQDILPYKFGPGLVFEFEASINEREEKELDRMALENSEMTENEIREKYNKEGFGPEYDKPRSSRSPQPGESEFNPMFTQDVRSR